MAASGAGADSINGVSLSALRVCTRFLCSGVRLQMRNHCDTTLDTTIADPKLDINNCISNETRMNTILMMREARSSARPRKKGAREREIERNGQKYKNNQNIMSYIER